MNNIIIKGRLSSDVEMKSTTNGKAVCNFSVAVNRRFKREEADFFRCTAWEKTAEFVVQYFKKGQEILIQGEMQCRNYDDKEGNKRTAWDLLVSNVEFCGNASDKTKSTNAVAEPIQTNAFVEVPISEEDLPF